MTRNNANALRCSGGGHYPRCGKNIMEKYGVQEMEDKLEKYAQSGCPRCGKKVTQMGHLLTCPIHGTEPFEATGDNPKPE